MNFNRMTVINGQVFKLKPSWSGCWTDMAGRSLQWVVSKAAQPRFSGTTSQCLEFIERAGAVYQDTREAA